MMWITTGAALLKPSLLSHCLLITFNFLTILYCQGRIILDLVTAASDVSDISEHTTGDFYRRWFVFYLDNFPLKPTFKFLHIVLICHPSMLWFSVNKSKPECCWCKEIYVIVQDWYTSWNQSRIDTDPRPHILESFLCCWRIFLVDNRIVDNFSQSTFDRSWSYWSLDQVF